MAAATATLVVATAGAGADTIEDALTRAYLNNPRLLAQRARVRSTDEQVPQALANWRPSVEVTSSVGAEVVDSNTSTGTDRVQSRRPKDVGVSITQPLFRGGRTLAATSEAEHNIRAERARLLDTEQQVLLDAATAYLNVFRDEAVLKLNVNQEQVLRRQLEATQDRFEVGEITRTDVHQAEARMARATADRIQAEGDLENSRANYVNVVGEMPKSALKLPPLFADLPEAKDMAIKTAVVANPRIVAADFDKRASLDNVDEVWGELLPSLELSASATKQFETVNEVSDRFTHDVTLSLTIPIYQQGAVYSRLRQARQTAAENAQLIDRQRRDISEQATQAWESMTTARARVAAFRTQVEANIVALEGVQREAAVGSRTVLDILDAEQELLDSRVGHVRAQRDELVAAYQLKSAMGGLTASDMKLPVELYDPRSHYKEVRGKWFGGRSTGGLR